ncbi:ketoacyl-synt-domain-containing protein [Lentinus brumalis]|uniref:Ketoacyl-synt-domain-containing protein n=1 Tax=Lentinus brumalis TaxID=2498619 RepID=A0A371D1N7_9APHY|nr:ketoacyl-synt-domain-containing protein [Polyporus brumalis]
MAVDFPGAANADAFWKLLEEGLNTVSKIPEERFNLSDYEGKSPGRSMNASHGNFLPDPGAFDNAFFHISPREARSMDPQQRLLLRTAYHALEDAGYSPNATASFDPDAFATYVGCATYDYVHNLRNDIDVYYSTGTLKAFLSGKISYAFGFGGPSMVLDTACSASVVGIHQACRALAVGDCKAALAGGVNVITSPDMYLGLARGHFLSETGQCRPWDASADGYCRSEGCGLFVLKRLADAIAENDRILAVIRGVEVNQSGNARSITHPHIPAQTALFRKLVATTGVHPTEISVVECHGTGTQAGDPTELQAVREVFGPGRTSDNPLYVTSVKANIGHAEAASGAASLAKVILMMKNRAIPRHPSFQQLNPRIPDLAADNVRINTATVPWGSQRKRLALLNNFGASGSNAALILEEYFTPLPTASRQLRASGVIVGLSCRSVAAVERSRAAYIAQVEESIQDDASLQDFAYTATARRQLHKYRISASGQTRDEVLKTLRSAKVVEVSAAENVVFVFSGQGSQYLGMGADLYRKLPLVARFVESCDRKLLDMGFAGVVEVFEHTTNSHFLDSQGEFEALHSGLFVLECALAELWISWGIRPCAVVGHSFGEYAALVCSGVLSLDDGLKLVATRARLIASMCAPNNTTMSSVRASPERVEVLLGDFPYLEMCCYNSPAHCTVGGRLPDLDAFEKLCGAQNIQYTRLDVPYAYHSEAMEPVLDGLRKLGGEVTYSTPQLPVLSNVTGALIQPGHLTPFTPDYFSRHCREPARFLQGISDLRAHLDVSAIAACIEIGPHPTTLSLMRSLQSEGAPLLVPSLRRRTRDFETLCGSLAQLYCTSAPVQWRKVFADLAPEARLIDLPRYPFADTRFWVPFKESATLQARAQVQAPLPLSHHLPAVEATPAKKPVIFERDISSVADLIMGHQVAGAALCPASVYTELAYSAAQEVLVGRSDWKAGDVLDMSDTVYPKPLVYSPGSQAKLRVEILPSAGGTGSFSVFSINEQDAHPQLHCTGSYKRKTAEGSLSKLSHAKPTLEREVRLLLSVDSTLQPETFGTRTVYDLLFPNIVSYSDLYRTIQTITVNTSQSTAYAVIRLPQAHLTSTAPFVTHPIFVDTLLHVAGFLINFTLGMNGRDACICSQVDKLKVVPEVVVPSAQYGLFASVTHADKTTTVADVYAWELAEPGRRIIASLRRARFRKVPMASLKRALGVGAAPSHARPALPRDAANQAVRRAVSDGNGQPTLKPVDIAAIPAKLATSLEDDVLHIIAETAGLAKDDIILDAELAHLGIDSLMIWELASRLRSILPVNTVDTHVLAAVTTVRALVDILLAKRGPRMREISATDSAVTLFDEDPEQCPSPPASLPSDVEDQLPGIDGLSVVKSVLSTILDIPVDQLVEDAELSSLGLDSLTSIEARHAFQTRLSIKIDEETMLACETVRDLVTAISVARSPGSPGGATLPPIAVPPTLETHMRPHVLRLQAAPAGSRVLPLILFHDGSGLISGYSKLAPLGCDVWAVQNTGYRANHALAGVRSGMELVSMAIDYVGLLSTLVANERIFQGGCILGGWSFGGVLAFDIGRRLASAGIKVNGLILIDSPAPQTKSTIPDSLIDAIAQKAFAGNGTSTRTVALVQEQMRYATNALVNYDPAQSAHAFKGPLRAVYLRSQQGNELPAYAGKAMTDARVRAFFTKTGDEWTVPMWEEVLGEKMVTVNIPGDHFGVFDTENIAEVSHCLKEALNQLC